MVLCWLDCGRIVLSKNLLCCGLCPRCAEAIGQNNVKNANGIIAELHDHSSSNGNGVQRMAHYVTTALVIILENEFEN